MEETSGVDQPFYLNDSESVTTDHLRSSDMRSLGDNVKLLAVIENLGCNLVSKSENAYKKIDEIDRESEVKSVAVKNLINEFQMLADSQFIENRIYDEDNIDVLGEITENSTADTSGNNKSSPDQKILPIIHECISSSLQFIDEKFDLPSSQIRQQNESDEEEDYVKEALAKAYESNPFNKTPLPSIIGSQEFFNQPLFNDGGNQAVETNREYCSEPSDKFSDDNDEIQSEDSDEEEHNLFTTINDSIRNYPLNSSIMQAENKLNGKDEVGYLNNSQLSTENKAEIERRALQKKPASLTNEFSDDGDDDDDDLFTASSTKIRTPNAKKNESTKSTKDKGNEESKAMKVAINIPSSSATEKIRSTLNSTTRSESDDSSDDSLFSDFKSKLSKILTNEPISNNRDSKRVSKEIRSPSISSTSSKDNAEKISAIQGQNILGEISNDERDDFFKVKSKSITPNITKEISDDDEDDDLFKTSSTKIRTSIANVDNSPKTSKEEKVNLEPKVMKVNPNIPSSDAPEKIQSRLDNTSRPESDDYSDDSLFSDFKSKTSKILADKPISDKPGSKIFPKEIPSRSTSSTSSKDNKEKISTIQTQNIVPEKNLLDKTSSDEKDDLFEVKSRPIATNITKGISDDDDDDDLFKTFSTKIRTTIVHDHNDAKISGEEKVEKEKSKVAINISSIKTPEEIKSAHATISGDNDDLFKPPPTKIRTSIAKRKDSGESKKQEVVDDGSQIMKVPINIKSSNAFEDIQVPLSSALRPESDDSSDDSLFSDFKSKSSKISTNKPISDSKRVSKEIRHPSASSTSSKDNAEKVSAIQTQNIVSERKLFDQTSSDEKDDLFEVKSRPIATNITKGISGENDDLFKPPPTKIRTSIAKRKDGGESRKQEGVDNVSQIKKVPIDIKSSNAFESIQVPLSPALRAESDDSSDDSLFSSFKFKSSKISTSKPMSDSKRVSKEIRSSSISSTSSKDNAEKISAIQGQNVGSQKNLFDETSSDEKDDLFEVQSRPIAPNITKEISDDDDDDLFKISSSKMGISN